MQKRGKIKVEKMKLMGKKTVLRIDDICSNMVVTQSLSFSLYFSSSLSLSSSSLFLFFLPHSEEVLSCFQIHSFNFVLALSISLSLISNDYYRLLLTILFIWAVCVRLFQSDYEDTHHSQFSAHIFLYFYIQIPQRYLYNNNTFDPNQN